MRRPSWTAWVTTRAGSNRASVDHEFALGLVESFHHHLRTPLAVVLGHAELLVDREHEFPDEMRHSLACLLRAAQRLDDVVVGVCDLVDIAWVGPQSADCVDLSELISDEVATHRDRAARRGVRILVSGERAQHCVVDSRRIRRALRELVDNALTYAPDESTVRVASTTSAAGIRISVSDEGDGIDSDDRARVARPFERGTHPRRPATGQGMGLALASAVAAWHGGCLVLSGESGRGFHACISFPRRGGRLR